MEDPCEASHCARSSSPAFSEVPAGEFEFQIKAVLVLVQRQCSGVCVCACVRVCVCARAHVHVLGWAGLARSSGRGRACRDATCCSVQANPKPPQLRP